MSKELTTEQINTLERCEKIIEKGQETFVEVGQALAIIRDNKLWKQGYGSFVEYVEERWGYGKSHAYRLIKAAEDVEPCQFSPVGENCQESSFVPGNERQAREIAKAGGEESQAEVAQAVTGAMRGDRREADCQGCQGRSGSESAPSKTRRWRSRSQRLEEAIEQGKAYCNEIRKGGECCHQDYQRHARRTWHGERPMQRLPMARVSRLHQRRALRCGSGSLSARTAMAKATGCVKCGNHGWINSDAAKRCN